MAPIIQIDYAEPKNFARVLEGFPRLTLILAHLGDAFWDERLELAQKYTNVYFDTTHGFSSPDQIPFVPRRALAEEDSAACTVCARHAKTIPAIAESKNLCRFDFIITFLFLQWLVIQRLQLNMSSYSDP